MTQLTHTRDTCESVYKKQGAQETIAFTAHRRPLQVTSTTGWVRLVGSLKVQVSFAEYSLFYTALSAEETYIFYMALLQKRHGAY